ncbi:hypothetical protein CVU37_14550 [candidate division BRC1 bacterium HGW-BRC1-1]|jgi:hypothetical protein|nr:MAG: hypothetical protein CVU37_14550 [candidate division BRC1 bacterium HGW-BRC1-1]
MAFVGLSLGDAAWDANQSLRKICKGMGDLFKNEKPKAKAEALTQRCKGRKERPESKAGR